MNREYAPERQARQLAERAKGTANTITDAIRPPGQRPPFHEQMSPRQALAWWLKHRYDSIGAPVLARMSPVSIAQLDAWLIHASQAATPNLQPAAKPSMQGQVPSGEGILSRAMSREQKLEGPPIGDAVA